VAAQPASTPTDIIIDTSPSTAERLAELLEGLGRFVALLGGLLAIGATAFTAFALVGTIAEIRRAIRWIRAAGALLVVGTLTQILMLAAASEGAGVLLDPVGILDSIPTGLAASAVLRIAGGVALMQAPTLVTATTRRPHAVPVGAEASPPVATMDREGNEPRHLVVREEWLILAGLAAIAVSYLLDGHSASLGVLARTANLVHVVAGGVWLGGVIVLGDLAIQRRRRSVPTRLAESAIRFSRVATVALIAVAAAGSGLLWSILENPGDLPSRAWGRLLLGKIVLVAVAAGIGAFNHYRVVPRLDRDPEQIATLSRTLRAESIILVLVAIVTAALVVAAP
jgi:copper transport protein